MLPYCVWQSCARSRSCLQWWVIPSHNKPFHNAHVHVCSIYTLYIKATGNVIGLFFFLVVIEYYLRVTVYIHGLLLVLHDIIAISVHVPVTLFWKPTDRGLAYLLFSISQKSDELCYLAANLSIDIWIIIHILYSTFTCFQEVSDNDWIISEHNAIRSEWNPAWFLWFFSPYLGLFHSGLY